MLIYVKSPETLKSYFMCEITSNLKVTDTGSLKLYKTMELCMYVCLFSPSNYNEDTLV